MGTTTKVILTYLLLFGCQVDLLALPTKIRAVFNDDPSTKITIIFDTSVQGTNPELFYGTSSQPVNSLTSSKATPSIINTNSGMVNNIVRLNNLIPGTVYYFKIRDNSGSTVVYNFETIPNQPTERLSFIAGGDSRSNRSSRVNANKLVAKFKSHAVIFDGDMTDNGSATSWKYWFEDWQYTIDNANRVTPIIPARGNHEGNDNFLIDLFGTPLNVYYASTFGGNLLRIYTLNSEKAAAFYGDQTTWFLDDLNDPANNDVIYKFAQYHKPMRPHVYSKLEGVAQYAYWSSIFYEYGFNVVVEGDAHTSKVTHPVIPCNGGYNCDEGFKRDDVNGTVYVGEGCWGAPLRPSNDNKIWTRDSGMYNQFKLIFVDLDGIEIRTISTDVETQVSEVNINNRFVLPSNENSWRLNDVVYVNNKKNGKTPAVSLISPPDNTTLYNTNPFLLYANASDPDGSIQRVKFYVNGILVNTDSTAPYQFNYNPSSYGQYLIHAIAEDNTGLASSIQMSIIKLLNSSTVTNTSKVSSTTDDAEEYANGAVDLLNYDLDLGYQNAICGVRFQKINIPKNSTITSADIRFTADEIKHNTTSLEIYAHDSASSETFFGEFRNVSSRPRVSSSVSWTPPGWTPVGASGSDQTTPNLKSIVQELVNKPDWEVSSPMTFIFEGSGYRVGETADGDSLNAAVLSVTYMASQDLPIINFVDIVDTIVCDKNDIIQLKAIALFPSSSIDEIEFKNGNSSLGTFTNNPAQINAPTSVAGNFTIKVVAEDNQGKKGEDNIVLKVIDDDCDPITGAASSITTQGATITWNPITPPTIYKLQYRKIGTTNWTTVNNITSEITVLVNLAINTTYQYRISYICENTTINSPIDYFVTTGICTDPSTQITAWEFNTSSNASILHWDIAGDATYKVYYKKVSENTWSSYCTVHPLVLLYGLDPCTTYQWYVQLVCKHYDFCQDAEINRYKTPTQQLSTIGCKTDGLSSNDLQTDFKVSAYPLPMKEHLNIEFVLPENSKTANVKLIDLNGKIIDSKAVDGAGKQHNVKFKVNKLISGTYLVLVEDGINSSYSKVLK